METAQDSYGNYQPDLGEHPTPLPPIVSTSGSLTSLQGDGDPSGPPADTSITWTYFNRVSKEQSFWNTAEQEWQ